MTEVLDDFDDLQGVFESVSVQVQEADYQETFELFMPRIAEQHAGMFAGEFDSNLNSWPPLAESTIKRKGHDRILVDTGSLRESLAYVGGSGNVHEAFERGLVFGTDVEYAMFHQTGTSKMPARPPVGLSEETLDKLCGTIADATVVAMKAQP